MSKDTIITIDTLTLPSTINRYDFREERRVSESPLYHLLPKEIDQRDSYKDIHDFKIIHEESFFFEQWKIKDKYNTTIAKINTLDELYQRNYNFFPQLYIASIYVDEDYRNNKIGSALMSLVLLYKRIYSNPQIDKSYLNCLLNDRDAERRERFYKELGFMADETTRSKQIVTMNLWFDKQAS